MSNPEPMQLIRIGGLYRLVTSRYLYSEEGRRLIPLNNLVVLLSHQQIMPNIWQVEVLFGEVQGHLQFGAYPFDLRAPYMILAKDSEE